MRISDWSSDVCSSDLLHRDVAEVPERVVHARILPVDDPHAPAVVEKVLAQRIAVAGRQRQRIGVERSAQRLRRLDHPVIALRQLRLLAVENRQIVVDHGKKLEAEAEFLAAAVHALQRFGGARRGAGALAELRSEEHTSELQSLMRNSYAV